MDIRGEGDTLRAFSDCDGCTALLPSDALVSAGLHEITEETSRSLAVLFLAIVTTIQNALRPQQSKAQNAHGRNARNCLQVL